MGGGFGGGGRCGGIVRSLGGDVVSTGRVAFGPVEELMNFLLSEPWINVLEIRERISCCRVLNSTFSRNQRS